VNFPFALTRRKRLTKIPTKTVSTLRLYSASFLALLAILILLPASAADITEPIILEIPQLQMQMEPNSAAVISSPDFDQVLIHINRRPGQVNYGTIFSKVNTESANIVMTTTSTADGILCKLDLVHRAGFRIHPGRNSIEVSFSDQMERVHYASFLLEATPPGKPGSRGVIANPTPRAPILPERAAAEKFAVVVGISRYANASTDFSNLKYADEDAKSVRDFLLSPEGGSFHKENMKVLLNEQATSQNIRSAFFTFLTQAQPEDEVVIYVAGHGAPDPNDPRNLYLLTYETKLDDMGGTAFPMFQMQDVFNRVLKAKRVVTFADTCHSYGFSGERDRKKKSNNLFNQYVARYANEADRAVITASDISQLSEESEQWGGGHGVFTYYLLKGLKGDADLNKDGTVTAGELFAYVHDNVEKATGGNQSPMALPGLAEHIPLSGVGLRKTQRSQAGAPSGTSFARGPAVRASLAPGL
jgi:uncharacterized caspase-like protein